MGWASRLLALLLALFAVRCSDPTAGPVTPNCLNGGAPCPADQICTVEGTCVPRGVSDAGGGDAGTVDAGTGDAGTAADAGMQSADGGAEEDGGASLDAGVGDGGTGECNTGDSQFCGSKVGVCRYGAQLCVDGRWGACVGGIAPSPEICDGRDNDCNGIIDDRDPPCECLDGQTQQCGSSTVGECRLGQQSCVDGRWAMCIGGVEPGTRQCDDKDRDCNGTLDFQEPPCVCLNGTTEQCGSSVGICRPGTRTCVGGQWGTCEGGVPPATTLNDESAAGLCNGLDDNCDGQIDEGCSCTAGMMRQCGTDVGLCEFGTQTCSSAGAWGACTGGRDPGQRVCDLDDHDCDGIPDYQQTPCQCRNGTTRPCGTDLGECVAGTQTCVNGQWGTCQSSIGPQPETCDGKDNDCDGTPDNGLNPPTATACWVRPGNNQLVCSDPHNFAVPPLATVDLDGRQSSDPDGQAVSYSWRLASAPAGSSVTISNPTSARPTLFAQLAGDYRVCLTVTDTTGCRSAESCVTIHVVPTSRIHIQLVWDKDETDVDLHFMLDSINNFLDDGSGPPGGAANCGRAKDCSFICKVPNWGAGGGGDDPRLDIDDVDGLGPENINLDAPFDQNPYVIAVHYWCDKPGPQYNGQSRGQTKATVRLYIDGALVRSWERTLRNRERWHVADIAWTNGLATPYVITDRNQVESTNFGCP